MLLETGRLVILLGSVDGSRNVAEYVGNSFLYRRVLGSLGLVLCLTDGLLFLRLHYLSHAGNTCLVHTAMAQLHRIKDWSTK